MGSKQLITAEEMDSMTPDQRAAAVDAGWIGDIDELPEPFRARVMAKAKAIEERLTPQIDVA